jgi:hypothetical protein
VLAIEDDGAGFEPGTARTGMGLENMRERARALGGTFTLATAPGGGTTARFVVPVRHRTLRDYAKRGLFWLALLAVNVALWKPAHTWEAAVSAIAVVAIARNMIAIVKLRRAGAAWR